MKYKITWMEEKEKIVDAETESDARENTWKKEFYETGDIVLVNISANNIKIEKVEED